MLQPVQRGEERRYDRADLQGLFAQFRSGDVERRPETECGTHERHGGAEQIERWRVAGHARDVGKHRLHGGGDLAQRRDLGSELFRLCPAGERSFEEEVPHVFDRALLRELDRVVLAVVVEAFEAAYVTDRRLGDDHTFEPTGDFVREVLGRLDLCDAHEVAHRHEADEPFAVDHRDVAVTVLGQAGERDRCVEVGRDAVGIGGHPRAHRVNARIGAGRRQSHEVTLGEDPDGAFAVDHDD